MTRNWIVIFAALLAFAPSAAADPLTPHVTFYDGAPFFDDAHTDAVAANLPGVEFLLRTKDGRTQFHCGERIQVQFVLSSQLENMYHCDPGDDGRKYLLDNDQFVCDALSGAVDPNVFTYLQYHKTMIEDRVDFSGFLYNPVVDTMDLNEWIAFDKPGTYRIYAVTDRVHNANSQGLPQADASGVETTSWTASTVLTLAITPVDKAWEHELVVDALKPALGPWDDLMETRARPLRYLRTAEAAVALLRLMESDHRYTYSDDKDWYARECADYMLESPSRSAVVPVMESDIASPDVPITENFLDAYCDLLYYLAYPLKDKDKDRSKGILGIRMHAISLLQRTVPTKLGEAQTISSDTLKHAESENSQLWLYYAKDGFGL